MARKNPASAQSHGLNDVLGVVLAATALLLTIFLLSFDRRDVVDAVPTNNPPHNLGGPIGAWSALALFRVFGESAFAVPALALLFAFGCLFQFMSFLRRRWLWGVVLLVCFMGLLRIFEPFPWLQKKIGAPSAGGFIGMFLYDHVLRYVGQAGATVVLGALYAISLLYLTNFKLGEWCRNIWAARVTGEAPQSAGDRELERRAKDLEKQARKLQDQLEKSGKAAKPEPSMLGPDLKPVPAPTVRDLSVPQSKPEGGKKAPAQPQDHSREPAPAEEAMVIPAHEVAAATTADVLGKSPAHATAEAKVEAPAPSAEAEPPPPRPRMAPRKPKPVAVASAPRIGNYKLPTMEFLQLPDATAKPTESKEALMANARLMQQTLAQFDIEVAVGDITKGPTITRYELHPAPGVKLERIVGLSNNIAAALKAERINVLAPVPGKSSVGVEVPNAIKTKVIMRDVFESDEWRNTKARVPLALGKDVYGLPIIADLAEMPHLLIAGSTGSGKSVCINAIICSLLYRFPPDQLRFVMIDPKVVELQQYNTLPHLVVPVVTDPKKVILALRWVVNEMEKRYQIFAKVGVRNIRSFNERPKHKPPPPSEPELPLMAKKEKVETSSEGFAVELDEEIVVPRDEEIVIPDRLSYIVVIIDELADLMLVAPADVEMAIARITQMARAAGIHCIVATQRPSVDVITGVIKANIPARIAFQVAAKVDSRTILDAMGADKLLGKGDMLYLPPGSAKLIRIQGALVTDQEIQSIIDFIAKQGKPSYEIEIHQQLQKVGNGMDIEEGASGEDEELIQQCIEVIRSEQKASVSLMQRRLRLGYTRAARIMDELELRGIVGPSKGAEPRDILIDLDVEIPGGPEEVGGGPGPEAQPK